MRGLTEGELKLAPDWATHYFFDCNDGTVIYESNDKCWWEGMSRPIYNCCLADKSKPIAREDFDITKHEFSDSDVTLVHQSNYEVWLDVNNGSAMLYKQDAIAIAKALGITGSDLA